MPCACRCALTTLAGIGPKRAFKLMAKHGALEEALSSLDPLKHPVPPSFDFVQARSLFLEHEVSDAATLDLAAGSVDEAGCDRSGRARAS